jgi:hypothetical protein
MTAMTMPRRAIEIQARCGYQVTLPEAWEMLGLPGDRAADAWAPGAVTFLCPSCDVAASGAAPPWRPAAGHCHCGGLVCATCRHCQTCQAVREAPRGAA